MQAGVARGPRQKRGSKTSLQQAPALPGRHPTRVPGGYRPQVYAHGDKPTRINSRGRPKDMHAGIARDSRAEAEPVFGGNALVMKKPHPGLHGRMQHIRPDTTAPATVISARGATGRPAAFRPIGHRQSVIIKGRPMFGTTSKNKKASRYQRKPGQNKPGQKTWHLIFATNTDFFHVHVVICPCGRDLRAFCAMMPIGRGATADGRCLHVRRRSSMIAKATIRRPAITHTTPRHPAAHHASRRTTRRHHVSHSPTGSRTPPERTAAEPLRHSAMHPRFHVRARCGWRPPATGGISALTRPEREWKQQACSNDTWAKTGHEDSAFLSGLLNVTAHAGSIFVTNIYLMLPNVWGMFIVTAQRPLSLP